MKSTRLKTRTNSNNPKPKHNVSSKEDIDINYKNNDTDFPPAVAAEKPNKKTTSQPIASTEKKILTPVKAASSSRKINPISISTYLQPEDWEGGEMFILNQSSFAYSEPQICDVIQSAISTAKETLGDTVCFVDEKAKYKRIYLTDDDDLESGSVEIKIVETYSNVLQQAKTNHVHKLVAMPSYSLSLSDSEQEMAGRKMITTLFAGLSESPQMQIKLVARTSNEANMFKVILEDVGKVFYS